MEPEVLKCKLILGFDLQKYSEAVFGKHNIAKVNFCIDFEVTLSEYEVVHLP